MNGTRKEKQIALTVKVKWLSVWENRDILLSQVVLLLDKVYQQCQLKFCLDVEIGVRHFFLSWEKVFSKKKNWIYSKYVQAHNGAAAHMASFSLARRRPCAKNGFLSRIMIG